MTVNAKTLVKDKFWILEENGQKLGTLQKKENNGWIFLGKQDARQVFDSPESLRLRFGIDIMAVERITCPRSKVLIPTILRSMGIR